MPMRDQCLMRGVGVVFSRLEMSGRFAVVLGSLRVVHRSRSMVFGCPVVFGHDVSNANGFVACTER